MRIDNLNKLIDHLKTQNHCGFNMAAFIHQPGMGFTGPLQDHSANECGTTACLAGHIWHITRGEDLNSPGVRNLESVMMINGQRFLDLSDADTCDLFLGVDLPDDDIEMENITLPQAIRCLEILRDTGKVNWKEAVQWTSKTSTN